MTNQFTADDIADTIASALDSLMVREDTDEPTWLGAYSHTLNETVVTVDRQTFRVTVEEVQSK